MSVFNAFVAYKFIKILSQPFKETDAYKLGIIDEKGKVLKKMKSLKTTEEKKAYTIFHRLIWNLKKTLEKLPVFRSRLASFAAALYLIKEHADPDGTLIEEAFFSYLRENGYDVDDMLLNESIKDTTIKRGLYTLNGKRIFVEEDVNAFDEIYGVPLFRVKGKVVAKEELQEDGAGAMAIGDGGNLAGLDGKPPVSKGTQKIHRRRAIGVTGGMKESVFTGPPDSSLDDKGPRFFAGARIFKVSGEEYGKCLLGRKKYERWNKKLDMELRSDIRKYAHRNPGKAIIVQNDKTGEMSYLVR
tara:strand:- start:239 stop:1138 length:900 start_codon:yes stop_codon:yes gene_type:complete